MPGKKKKPAHSRHPLPKKNRSLQGFYTPFEQLDQHLARKSALLASVAPQGGNSKTVQPISNDEAIFHEAMSDVVPLAKLYREKVPAGRPAKILPRFLIQEELEVYEHLVDLITGEGQFELTYSDEYIDGAVVGLSPDILRKLRNGDFSYQGCLDLHGFNRDQARELVSDYLFESFSCKRRCVLIVSGRGLNSKDKEPVLKHNLATWLTRAPLKRLVLAFASARSWDGGAGAFYVLLRRNKGKAPLVCPAR